MEPRWSPPIPQAMQRHGGRPKNVPVLERAKEALTERDQAQYAPGAPMSQQDRQVFDRAA